MLKKTLEAILSPKESDELISAFTSEEKDRLRTIRDSLIIFIL